MGMKRTRPVLGVVVGALLTGCSLLPLPLTDAQRIWCDDHVLRVRDVGRTLGILEYDYYRAVPPTPEEAQAWDRSCRAAYDLALRPD